MKTLFILLMAANSYAAVPSILLIEHRNVDHSSANVLVETSVGAYVQLFFGTVSGTYTSQTSGIFATTGYFNHANPTFTFNVSGLIPGTRYYYLVKARPNQGNNTDICEVSGCGAVEHNFTTAALPNPHPRPPDRPIKNWPTPSGLPEHPNTAGYTVINTIIGAAGELVADKAYTSTTGCAWPGAVAINDTITQILSKIGNGSNGCAYGTVIEYPMRSLHKVIESEATFHSGIALPGYAIDPNAGGDINASAHRWVVFRPRDDGKNALPPFGVRTGPQFASALPKWIVQTPNSPQVRGSTPSPGSLNYTGQILSCYYTQCHHFWFENTEWGLLNDGTVSALGEPDPASFGAYTQFNPGIVGSEDGPTMPTHIVFDRIYAHATAVECVPSLTNRCPRQIASIQLGGHYAALLSSYIQSDFWYPGIVPLASADPGCNTLPSMVGAVLTIPKYTWQFSANDSTPIGMTGSAVITFSGSGLSTYSGPFFGWIGAEGFSLSYPSAVNVSATCVGTGCGTLTAHASPSLADMPRTSMYLISGSFTGGAGRIITFSPGEKNIEGVVACDVGPSALANVWFPAGVLIFNGNFGVIDNNYIEAPGQTIYNDALGDTTDWHITRNYLHFPRTKIQRHPTWNGVGYRARNDMEFKDAVRWDIDGNIIDGSEGFQNLGQAISLAGSGGGFSTTPGVNNVSVTNNIIRHAATGIVCAGSGVNSGSPPLSTSLLFGNNLLYDINAGVYSSKYGKLNDWPPGFNSGAHFLFQPGCQDVEVSNNTFEVNKGYGPAMLMFGNDGTENSLPVDGFKFVRNVAHASLSGNTLYHVIYQGCGYGNAGYKSSPPVSCPTNPANMIPSLDLWFAQGTVPNWVLQQNLIVGGYQGTNYWPDVPTWANLTQVAWQAELTNLGGVPAGNVVSTNCTAAGTSCGPDSYAGRLAAINYSPDHRILPSTWNAGAWGASISAIEQAAGTVTDISTLVGPTSFQISYTAPDTRACSVDVSADGLTWTRATDSGGARRRTLSVLTGITAAAAHQFRLNCYAQQCASYTSTCRTAEYGAKQITDGTFTTPPAAATSVSLSFDLSTFGASSFKVTLSPISGADTTKTCTVSPCVVSSLPAGDYLAVRQYLAGSTRMASSTPETISAR